MHASGNEDALRDYETTIFFSSLFSVQMHWEGKVVGANMGG